MWPDTQRNIIKTTANIGTKEWTFTVLINAISQSDLESISSDSLEQELTARLITAFGKSNMSEGDREIRPIAKLNNTTRGRDSTQQQSDNEQKITTKPDNDKDQLTQLQKQVKELQNSIANRTPKETQHNPKGPTELQIMEKNIISKLQEQHAQQQLQQQQQQHQQQQQQQKGANQYNRSPYTPQAQHTYPPQKGTTMQQQQMEPKTIPCIDHFSKTGTCTNGPNCPRSHDERDRRVCMRFRQGQCQNGNACTFAHTQPGQDPSQSTSTGRYQPKPAGTGNYQPKPPFSAPPGAGTCRQYMSGNCTFTVAGKGCKFEHPAELAASIKCTRPGCRGIADTCPHQH
jgi:hypothetical protein